MKIYLDGDKEDDEEPTGLATKIRPPRREDK